MCFSLKYSFVLSSFKPLSKSFERCIGDKDFQYSVTSAWKLSSLSYAFSNRNWNWFFEYAKLQSSNCIGSWSEEIVWWTERLHSRNNCHHEAVAKARSSLPLTQSLVHILFSHVYLPPFRSSSCSSHSSIVYENNLTDIEDAYGSLSYQLHSAYH